MSGVLIAEMADKALKLRIPLNVQLDLSLQRAVRSLLSGSPRSRRDDYCGN
jgi:hypothetical protein